jgi:aryl-alcohol dehydrogenase-like predicted oxidoreductase
MEFRHVGEGGPVASAIGLSCPAWGASGVAAAPVTVGLALDLGITLLVLTEFRDGGASERIIGQAVRRRRDEVLIVTQGGARFAHDGLPQVLDGSPASLKRACAASLRRLGLDHIDLFILGQVDPQVPIADSVGAMAELVASGEVRYIGLPAVPAKILRTAHAEHPIAGVIGEYSLWHRHAERELLPAARELGVGFLACGPLGRGFLTGRVTSADQIDPRDPRRHDPRFRPANLRKNRERLRAAEEIASHRDIGIGRMALAWILAMGDDIIPVPSTRYPTHVEMNSSAADVRLTARECRALAEIFPPGIVAGSDEWVLRSEEQA